MVKRTEYLEKLKKIKDMQIIKVITGVRRCGKSTLLSQFRNFLIESGVFEEQIIFINFEDLKFEDLKDYKLLYQYISERLVPNKKNYIFIDEIQEVENFQRAVDSLFIKDNTDIYITGSNAMMLSGELATLLSGRYIEISILPLSFSEYLKFDETQDMRQAWNKYFENGGFPYATQINDDDIRKDYLMGIYNTVLLKDIVARNKVQDITLLESIVKFLFENIGNIVSPKKIADTLVSYGRKTTSSTVENYIEALKSSFILYKAGRYDIKGKQHLKSLEKYYIVDIGLRKLLINKKHSDIGHILENIVYLELIRRGYTVYIGKIGDLEIDFIAERNNEREYYQVSATILDENTFKREITPLKKVKDNFHKNVSFSEIFDLSEERIESFIEKLRKENNIPKEISIFEHFSDKIDKDFEKKLEKRFSNDKVCSILNLFKNRENDEKISKEVTDNAKIPTIFEYMLAIAWHRISNKEFNLKKSLKLSLDGDGFPLSHAPGGDGDIIAEYSDFDVMIEATLMDRNTQKRGELEPVIRHTTNLTIKNMEENKETYTFFVANELDMNVINIFRATSQIRLQSTQNREKYTNGIKIYSLTIDKIVYLLENNINYKYFLNRVFENYSKIEFIGKNWCEDTWNNSIEGENIGKV